MMTRWWFIKEINWWRKRWQTVYHKVCITILAYLINWESEIQKNYICSGDVLTVPNDEHLVSNVSSDVDKKKWQCWNKSTETLNDCQTYQTDIISDSNKH